MAPSPKMLTSKVIEFACEESTIRTEVDFSGLNATSSAPQAETAREDNSKTVPKEVVLIFTIWVLYFEN